MSKQDRQGVRTAAGLEQKYKFGKSFAAVMGIATDAQKKAEEASSSYENLDHDEVFNLLTKNGALQGLYRGADGELYINASYLKSGKILADLIDGNNLKIERGSTIAGWNIDNNSIFNQGDGLYKDGTFMSTGTNIPYSIGGSDEIPSWVFGAGGKFGVTKGGAVYADDVHLQGDIDAKGGTIGGWMIGDTLTSTKEVSVHLGGDTATWEQKAYLAPDGIRVVLTYKQGNPIPPVTMLESKIYWYQLAGIDVAASMAE